MAVFSEYLPVFSRRCNASMKHITTLMMILCRGSAILVGVLGVKREGQVVARRETRRDALNALSTRASLDLPFPLRCGCTTFTFPVTVISAPGDLTCLTGPD